MPGLALPGVAVDFLAGAGGLGFLGTLTGGAWFGASGGIFGGMVEGVAGLAGRKAWLWCASWYAAVSESWLQHTRNGLLVQRRRRRDQSHNETVVRVIFFRLTLTAVPAAEP